jgi:hypothetical protein
MSVELLKAGLALIGGIIGAYLGTRLGLRKTKLERSHERRLDWHREAHGIILDLDEQRRAISWSDPVRSAEFQLARKRFNRIVAEAPAYMRTEGARGLWLAEVQLWEAQRTTVGFIKDGEEPDLISQALGYEGGYISDAEKYVLDGLKRLMPWEPEYPWRIRAQGYFTQIWRRRSRKRRGIQAKQRSLAANKAPDAEQSTVGATEHVRVD